MRLRLFLSFTLITIITLLVFGVVVRGQTQTTITTFAKSGGFLGADRLVSQLESYYLENGSWEAVSLLFTESTTSTQNLGGAENFQGQGAGPSQGRGNARGGNMFMGGQGAIGDFTLADSNGQVLVSNNFDLSEILPITVLENALPITVKDQLVGYLVPDNNILDISEIISQNLALALNDSLLPTVLITGSVALILALILAYFLMNPVRKLTDAAGQLARGDLSQRVPVRGGAELNQLAKTFNRMAETLERSHQARKAMTSDIAHELRTPLAVQKANLEAIQDGIYPMTLENLDPIIQQNILLNKLVEDLRTLATTDSNSLVLDKTATDLVPFIEKICENVRPQFEANRISLRAYHRGDCPNVSIDQNRINQVIYNLLQNSLRHTPPGGFVELSLYCDENFATLSVRDSGEGIPESSLPLIFERFYRADQSRARDKGGTGLGLTIALRLVEAHNGTLTAANHPGGGAMFTLTLPLGG